MKAAQRKKMDRNRRISQQYNIQQKTVALTQKEINVVNKTIALVTNRSDKLSEFFRSMHIVILQSSKYTAAIKSRAKTINMSRIIDNSIKKIIIKHKKPARDYLNIRLKPDYLDELRKLSLDKPICITFLDIQCKELESFAYSIFKIKNKAATVLKAYVQLLEDERFISSVMSHFLYNFKGKRNK